MRYVITCRISMETKLTKVVIYSIVRDSHDQNPHDQNDQN